MPKGNRRLILLGLVACLASIYAGCSQPEDVLVKESNTYVFLTRITNFPSSYDGMDYELWAGRNLEDGKFETVVSLGKFGYNNKLQTFLDADGLVKEDSNRFLLTEDLFDFTHIFISVEKDPDDDPLAPSAIMLIDDAVDPGEDAIDMIFPEIADTILLWSATVRFSMETVSDDSTFIRQSHLATIENTRNTASNGFGLWFANYRRVNDSLRDTTRLVSFFIRDTVKTFERDTVVVSIQSIDSVWLDTIRRVFGLDTLDQIVVRFDPTLFIDSTDPETVYTVDWFYETNPPIANLARPLSYDDFTQDNFRLPNFTEYGWKYKGWVVSPGISTTYGTLNPPGWNLPYNDSARQFYWIPGDFGGLLTTGTFGQIDMADDTNLYTKSDRTPPFPGDEFFNLPDGGGSLNLVPGSNTQGTVFITLEPIVLQDGTNKTNFPLFVMTAPLPSSRSQVMSNTQSFNMKNWSSHTDPGRGFPKISVEIERF